MEYQGLNDKQVEERISKGLKNESDNNISKSRSQIVKEHTLTYFNFLNIFLAAIVVATGNIRNALFVGVVFFNTIIGIIQEFRVKSVVDKIEVVTATKVKTVRNGKMTEVGVDDLVMDDVIFVESGDQIASDCKVLTSQGIEVNESMLTGESESIKKKPDDELWAGSYLVSGSGYAQVIRVGQDNYATQLVKKAKNKRRAASEMRDTIEDIIKILSIVIVPVGLILFYSQLTTVDQTFNEAIVHTVGGVVGMIPEGLVLLTSISFVLGVGKLATKDALVQEMEAIEALARVDVLCLDKTGTITSGELNVEAVEVLDHAYSKEHVHRIMGGISHAFDDVNATQKALMNYFEKENFEITKLIPFSSERKYRAIGFEGEGYFVLGAPEFLSDDQKLLDKINEYSAQGCRVLLLCRAEDIHEEDSSVEGLSPLAFITIKDVIRNDAKEILGYFSDHDVEVKIISGDNPVTVSRVAMDAGVNNAQHYVDASTLPDDEAQLDEIIDNNTVFGRIKPEQKQTVIKALQRKGHIVGMVGDGVNDVLALKDSDCGIAMAAGSEAARQAAHIVLLKSDFACMKDIVEEGRSIIANIERVSSLYLTKTIYSTLLCVAFVFLQASYPFEPIQLTMISTLAIGIPSFYLTLESSALLNSDGFLSHVMNTALPCAIAMFIYIVGLRFLGMWMNFDSMLFSTYYFLTAAFISFVVVFIVCLPVDKIRIAIMIILAVLFVGIIALLPSFFGIYSMFRSECLWLIPICISSIFVILLLQRGIQAFNKYYQNRKVVKNS